MPTGKEKDSISAKSCQGETVKSSTNETNGGKIGVFICHNSKCQHNIFYEKVFEPSKYNGQSRTNFTPHETSVSREFCNCMLLLDRVLTLEEVGEIYGVSRQAINRHIKLLLKYLKKENGNLREHL